MYFSYSIVQYFHPTTHFSYCLVFLLIVCTVLYILLFLSICFQKISTSSEFSHYYIFLSSSVLFHQYLPISPPLFLRNIPKLFLFISLNCSTLFSSAISLNFSFFFSLSFPPHFPPSFPPLFSLSFPPNFIFKIDPSVFVNPHYSPVTDLSAIKILLFALILIHQKGER